MKNTQVGSAALGISEKLPAVSGIGRQWNVSAINLIVFPVSNLEPATRLYKALLGVEPYMSSPYYVGFRVGDQEIGLDPSGRKKAPGPIAYRDVPDLNSAINALTAAGATVTQNPTDVGGGMMIALLTDTDGNTLGLRQS